MRQQKDQKNKFIVVEANIGVGKSTFLPKLVQALKETTGEEYVELQEPVDDPVFDELLHKFYETPTTENRIKFQYYITDRRAKMVQDLPEDKHYVLERSLLSDTIFSQVNMLEMEKPDGCYLNYFYYIKEKFKDYPKINACIYLKADPRVAYDRMKARGRAAEDGVKFSYLDDLHRFHEAVLPQECRVYGIPLLTFDWSHFGNPQMVADEVLDIFRYEVK